MKSVESDDNNNDDCDVAHDADNMEEKRGRFVPPIHVHSDVIILKKNELDAFDLAEDDKHISSGEGMGVYGIVIGDDTVLRNGEYQLSRLTLKSVEPALSRTELAQLKKMDLSFKSGWLFDEVIDSFMWNMQQVNTSFVFLSTTLMAHLERKGTSIHLLWRNEDLTCKDWVFSPWNPSRYHWILVAFQISTKMFYLIDPLHNTPQNENSRLGLQIFSAVLKEKFDIIEKDIKVCFPIHTLQMDANSCGL